MDQPTPKPTDKVTAGGIGGLVVLVITGIIRAVSEVEPPQEVVAAAALLITFVFSYFTPERSASEV